MSPAPTPSSSWDKLSLATFAVCLDTIENIAEARGILPLRAGPGITAQASDLRDRMISGIRSVGSGLLHTRSRAFGQDDPLTASWLLPILSRDLLVTAGSPAETADRREPEIGNISLFGNVRDGLARLLSREREKHMVLGGPGGRENTAKEHAWPASLAVRALNLVTRGQPESALDAATAEELRVWSEQEVRQQLARSVTGEAGQDAAHLAAALAVAMWLDELPLPLLEAAVEQLCKMQRPDGSLVLTRPYLADTEGSAITPRAADVTLAMIAVADQLDDRYPEHPTVLRIQRQLLEAVQHQREAYFRSSLRKGGTGPSSEAAMLWSKEHARPTPGECDTWATARTVTALVMILNLECRHITRRLLEESRFSFRRGGEIRKGFDKIVDPELQEGPHETFPRPSGGASDRGQPQIIVTPDYRASPLTIQVQGTGFRPRDEVTVTLDGVAHAAAADESGSFTISPAVRPSTRPGAVTVTASGTIDVATAHFRRTVRSALRDGLTEPDPDPDRNKIRAVLLGGPPGTSKTSLIEAVAKELAGDLVKKHLGQYSVYVIQLSPADFLLDGPDRVEHRAKRIFDYLMQMENVVVLFDEIDRLVLDRDSREYRQQEGVFQFMTPSMLPKLTGLRERGSVVRFAIATNYGERIDAAIARIGRIDESYVIAPPNLNARLRILEELPDHVAGGLAAVTPLWVYGDLKTLGSADDPDTVMLRPPSVSIASYESRWSTPRKAILANEILQLAELYLEGRGRDILAARGPDELRGIEWASDHTSPDRRANAAKLIEQLTERG